MFIFESYGNTFIVPPFEDSDDGGYPGLSGLVSGGYPGLSGLVSGAYSGLSGLGIDSEIGIDSKSGLGVFSNDCGYTISFVKLNLLFADDTPFIFFSNDNL